MGRRPHWREGEDWGPEVMRGEGERGGRRRMFDGGELKLLLLELLREEPRHGYELIRAVESLSRGVYAPSPGVVYPTLALLKDMLLIREDEGESARKLYNITPEGQAHLDQNRQTVAALRQRLDKLAQLRERTDAAPVRRAMVNLKSALFNKLSGGASRETVLQVAALIDEAAQKIERL